MESKVDGNLTRSDICNHLRDEEWVKLRTILLVSTIVLHFILESLDTTDTYTEYNANVVQVFLLKIDISILYTLHGSNHSQLGITVKLASFLTINPIIDV